MAGAGAGAPPLLAADLGPGVRAGFTTRAGGVSPPPWDSLNLGAAVDDKPARVRANRERLAAAFGPVAFAHQVHGADVVEVEAPPADVLAPVGAADAIVTAVPGVALGVLVADCVPVLLADAAAGVVASAHAGRRGLAAGVVRAVLDAMAERGARRIRAVVGPSVCGRCYEVPAALQAEVVAVAPRTRSTTSWGTPALDLGAGVLADLAAAGVVATRLEICPRTDPRFFSHRRDGITGRFAGIVRLDRG